jgi:hypothetical protein
MSTRPNALAEDVAAAGDPYPTLEQLDLIADGQVQGKSGLERLRNARRMHQRGRPPGSRNKRTGKLRDYYLAQFQHPLIALGRMANMPPDAMMQLLTELQGADAKHKPLRAIEVLRFQADLQDRIAPYIEGKQPLSIEVAHRKDLTVLVPGLNAPGLDQVSLDDLAAAIEAHGLAAFDPETLKMLPPPVDADFDDVDDVPDDSGGAE